MTSSRVGPRHASQRSPVATWRAGTRSSNSASPAAMRATVTATSSPRTSSALTTGPRAIDCLEFDDRLRYGDVLADLAFLAMDLERLGRPDLSRVFLDRYRDAAHDAWPRSLEHMYIAYRAHVRAKIACLRHVQGDRDAATEAGSLLRLAHDHLETGRVRLVLVGGPPASGKSTLAEAIGEKLGWVVLRSDVVRKELAGLAPRHVRRCATGSGSVRPAASAIAHTRTLVDRARPLLALGESVVIDGSWSQARWRTMAAGLAESTSSEMFAFRCDAPEDLRRARAGETRRTRNRCLGRRARTRDRPRRTVPRLAGGDRRRHDEQPRRRRGRRDPRARDAAVRPCASLDMTDDAVVTTFDQHRARPAFRRAHFVRSIVSTQGRRTERAPGGAAGQRSDGSPPKWCTSSRSCCGLRDLLPRRATVVARRTTGRHRADEASSPPPNAACSSTQLAGLHQSDQGCAASLAVAKCEVNQPAARRRPRRGFRSPRRGESHRE